VFPGTTYEDWPLDDPTGQDIDTVRRIVGEVEQRVLDLLARITWSSRAREQADAERATGLETV
jgi:hypothetical protein